MELGAQLEGCYESWMWGLIYFVQISSSTWLPLPMSLPRLRSRSVSLLSQRERTYVSHSIVDPHLPTSFNFGCLSISDHHSRCSSNGEASPSSSATVPPTKSRKPNPFHGRASVIPSRTRTVSRSLSGSSCLVRLYIYPATNKTIRTNALKTNRRLHTSRMRPHRRSR